MSNISVFDCTELLDALKESPNENLVIEGKKNNAKENKGGVQYRKVNVENPKKNGSKEPFIIRIKDIKIHNIMSGGGNDEKKKEDTKSFILSVTLENSNSF